MIITLYSDFNCPFCFAQNERIQAVGLDDRFSWQYVEHAPEINTKINTTAQIKLLNDEYKLICQRAPDIVINNPNFCVNSSIAILTLISFSIKHPDEASTFRTAIYRAYWQDGLDISNVSVLERILQDMGHDSVIQDRADELFLYGQNKWLNGDMDQRIPSLSSEDNRLLLGLQNIYNIENFIKGAEVSATSEFNDVCVYSPSPKIVIINMPEVVNLFSSNEQEHEFEFIGLSSIDDFLLLSDKQEIKAIIFPVVADSNKPWQALHTLRSSKYVSNYLPIIAVMDNKARSLVKQGYLMGVTDIFKIDEIDENFIPCLKSRIVQHGIIEVLENDASIDGLTSIANKRLFTKTLEKEWRQAARKKSNLCLIMIDIDYFKKYNDFYGHCAGDLCLQKVAEVLSTQVIRPSDLVARFGGEEFVILLPDTGEAGLDKIMKKVQKAVLELSLPHLKSPVESVLTISQGGVLAEPHADHTPLQMLEIADKALYQAKNSGRNRFEANLYPDPIYS